MAGRTRCPRKGTGAACCTVHNGCRRDPHTACKGVHQLAFYNQGLSIWAVGSREVRDGEEGILIEYVALEEPLEQFPRHWAVSVSVCTADYGATVRSV